MKKLWLKEQNGKLNVSLSFRYIFEKDYGKVTINLAAVSTFRVFLNGEFLFAGPSRTAKGYSAIHRFTMDIKAGDILTADVCNYYINAFYPVKEEGFFACELTCENALIADTGAFNAYILTDRVEKTQRINFQRSFTEAYEMHACRTQHYLGKELFPKAELKEVQGNILTQIDYPYCAWNRMAADGVLEYGSIRYSNAPNALKQWVFEKMDKELVQGYPKDEWEIRLSDEVLRMRFYAEQGEKSALGKDEYALYSFPRNLTGFVTFAVEAEEDCELLATFDELIWDEFFSHPLFVGEEKWQARPLIFNRMRVCNAVMYRLKKGSYTLTFSEPYTLQYLKIACTKGKARVVGMPQMILMQNDDAYGVQFSHSNEKLQAVFEAGRHSLSQNAFDVLTDCPGRERAGWLCDSYFAGPAETALCGNNLCEENFFRCFLLEEECAHLPKEMFPMCCPADHNDGVYIPNWAMWLILEVADYGKRTGNTYWQDAFKARFYNLLQFFSRYLNEDGLLENLDGWVFVEWSKCNDFIDGVNYPSNMLYAKTLSCMAEMYGDEALEKQARAVREKIIAQSFDGCLFRDHAIRKDGKLCVQDESTETCQYYAFTLDIVNEKEYAPLAQTMLERVTPHGEELSVNGKPLYKANSFIGNYLRFLYLARTGRYAQLMDETVEYSYPMASRTGTLWEHNATDGSCNHGFTAILSKWILEGCGYFGYDKTKGVAYVKSPSIQGDFCIRVQVAGGELCLCKKDGDFLYSVPEGVKIVNI